MNISMIVAYGKNKELGLDNKLLWHIPKDLENFKKITNEKHVFMGSKTFDSILAYLKQPLKNRISIILTNSQDKYNSFDNLYCVNNIEDGINIAYENTAEELVIIGGASVYKQAFPLVDTLYITEVDFEGEADCFFEDEISDKEFDLIEETHFEAENNAPAWTFKIYKRKK